MKQYYTRRIANANRTGMVVLTYEIALQYLSDARDAKTHEEFEEAVRMARRCVEQLREALDYKYGLSFTLVRLYDFITIEMDKAIYRRDASCFEESGKILETMHNSFEKIQDQDQSAPLMQNAEAVYSGMTYGRNGANESTDGVNRGFTV